MPRWHPPDDRLIGKPPPTAAHTVIFTCRGTLKDVLKHLPSTTPQAAIRDVLASLQTCELWLGLYPRQERRIISPHVHDLEIDSDGDDDEDLPRGRGPYWLRGPRYRATSRSLSPSAEVDYLDNHQDGVWGMNKLVDDHWKSLIDQVEFDARLIESSRESMQSQPSPTTQVPEFHSTKASRSLAQSLPEVVLDLIMRSLKGAEYKQEE
ncbi:hypothetical protein HK097_011312 [Rhizophlyctis rosea]|uniref:Uncharacterized protein n=1 Tax=Rhizophlyctis rosea TaxID=64517 RepID=A0AAD5SJZ0_9FUNG|nr:hypothetical protein HK097_011312 [Rhizophlyctis rosea]